MAVLEARGQLSGPCDREGFEKLEATLPFLADEDRIRQAAVDMPFGSAKEGVVLAAAMQALQAELQEQQLCVRETGFTSCNMTGERCALQQWCTVRVQLSLSDGHCSSIELANSFFMQVH